ncbi:PrkA family serine protein kinase [Rhizobium sp. Pop5]|nr:PrkA family serine protein kinase [Rhizobium sp. Pop5]
MLSESVFDAFTRSYEARRETDMSVSEYLDLCKKEPLAYANATERLLAAIGEPQMVDTSRDARLGRIFMNRTIRIYPAFAGFHGMEETIERIVPFSATPRRVSRNASRSSISSARSVAANRRWRSG